MNLFIWLIYLNVTFCFGYTYNDTDTDLFPFQNGYQVDFNEDFLSYIILRIPLLVPNMLEGSIQIEQFGYSVREKNTTGLSMRALNFEQYSIWDGTDTVKLTCFRKNNTDKENISLLLQMDAHEKGKANIFIEDSMDLKQGDQQPIHCTSKGSIRVMNHPIKLENEGDLPMAVESVGQENSNDTLIRLSATENIDNIMNYKMMIVVYRSVDETHDGVAETDLDVATTETEVATPEAEQATTETGVAANDTVVATTEMELTTQTRQATSDSEVATMETGAVTTEMDVATTETDVAATEMEWTTQTEPATSDSEVATMQTIELL